LCSSPYERAKHPDPDALQLTPLTVSSERPRTMSFGVSIWGDEVGFAHAETSTVLRSHADCSAMKTAQNESFRDIRTSSLEWLTTIAFIVLLLFVLCLSSAKWPVSRSLARALAELFMVTTLVACAARVPAFAARDLRVAILPFATLVAFYLWAPADTSAWTVSLVAACVLVIGGLIGGYIGGLLEAPGMIAVVAYVATVGDVFSVFHPHGVSAHVLRDQAVLRLLTLSFPVLGTQMVSPMVGVGDVAFTALYVVATRKLGLSVRRCLLALTLGLLVTVVSVECLQIALPAVPFFSAAVVLAQKQSWRLPVADAPRIKRSLVALTLVLGALLLVALHRR